MPEPSRTSLSPVVGPELVLLYAPGASRWSVGIVAGLDIVPLAPVVGYDVAGRFDAAHGLWRAEPRALLAAGLSTK
jgi:hypothetical protein